MWLNGAMVIATTVLFCLLLTNSIRLRPNVPTETQKEVTATVCAAAVRANILSGGNAQRLVRRMKECTPFVDPTQPR
jgi:hypothetical protein